MIRFVQGNIFDSGCEALVNPVNCVGVMGKGLALQFKRRFPANFTSYAAACRRRDLAPGRLHVFDAGVPRLIVNFPTKRHWRDASRLDDVTQGLHALAGAIATNTIRSIAIPPLGCGLGGLPWPDVRQLILHHLSTLDGVDVVIHGPAPE
ncbi:MAG: macro domain-containing protein [Deltaproteobacteria bacterium]|nr:macro domain-containing protein [Deltaproteobacteria bacterium]